MNGYIHELKVAETLCKDIYVVTSEPGYHLSDQLGLCLRGSRIKWRSGLGFDNGASLVLKSTIFIHIL